MPTDIELWEKWKDKPTRRNLRPLLQRFDVDINKRVTEFNKAEVPHHSRRMEARRLAVEAFKTYNPNMGTSLKTHVYTHLRRLSRYVGQRQNIGRIPENRVLKIHDYKKEKDYLQDRLNREPSIQELAGRLNWDIAEIERLESELQGAVVSSGRQDQGIDLVFSEGAYDVRLKRIIRQVYYELTPEEQTVYEYLVGMGKPKLNETNIAKKLGMSITKVSRIKHNIGKKIERYV